jgi:ubiquinone/menaquinone biosynthesis C-methylase UbiE
MKERFSVSKLQDTKYLLNDQYHTSDKLNARIRLHVGFSTNDYGWFRWVFDHFHLEKECRVLELGSGPGDMWLENINRIPEGWEITLSDFSHGMVAKLHERLATQKHSLGFGVIDAQSIPFGDEVFDIVIANHCIYHFPDRLEAFSEIKRVLKSDGIFYATTVGKSHLLEMTELVARFGTGIEDNFKHEENPFTLESGAAQLSASFSEVEAHRFPDSLLVNEAAPLVDFIFSTARLEMDERLRADFTAFTESEILKNGGAIRIQKDSGIFISVN